MLRYSSLTPEQKEAICNGCGGKGGLIKPPDFIFHASCNQHDFYYWRGGGEKDRELADRQFYEAMSVDISNAKWYLRPYYHFWAYIYYLAVRIAGRKFFNYGLMRESI